MYLPSANTLSFSTNSTQRLTITSSGNAGLGTSSPSSGAGADRFLTIQGTASAAVPALILAPNLGNTHEITSYNGLFRIYNSSNIQVTLSNDGNLGLGVTPSAWNSAFKVLQFSNSGAIFGATGDVYLGNNIYENSSGTNTYITTNFASMYRQVSGTHIWYKAPSGTAGNPITFTNAMSLDASGNLLVGTTSDVTTNVGSRLMYGSADPYISSTLTSSSNATTSYLLYSTGAGAYRFYVGMGGTVFATSIVISAISDQRLKENIRDIETGLSTIMALKPRRFDWKEGKGQDKKNVAGFIAQEFEDVFPECVSTAKAGEDGIEYKNINHETLIPTLVKAIQELKAEFDAYKTTHP
jgi:hypothetical protein